MFLAKFTFFTFFVDFSPFLSFSSLSLSLFLPSFLHRKSNRSLSPYIVGTGSVGLKAPSLFSNKQALCLVHCSNIYILIFFKPLVHCTPCANRKRAKTIKKYKNRLTTKGNGALRGVGEPSPWDFLHQKYPMNGSYRTK